MWTSSRVVSLLPIVAASIWVAACDGPPPAPVPPQAFQEPAPEPAEPTPSSSAPAPSAPLQTGLASYYADALAGHKTASGERYDPAALTAAHRTLPFGTLVEVSREGGAKVVVRINDRGPFGRGQRIIDLSRRAAEEIGIVKLGVTKVELRVVGTAAR